jgi:hypothetical protein
MIPAGLVSALGQGNSDAGAKVLDSFLAQLAEMLSTSEEGNA